MTYLRYHCYRISNLQDELPIQNWLRARWHACHYRVRIELRRDCIDVYMPEGELLTLFLIVWGAQVQHHDYLDYSISLS